MKKIILTSLLFALCAFGFALVMPSANAQSDDDMYYYVDNASEDFSGYEDPMQGQQEVYDYGDYYPYYDTYQEDYGDYDKEPTPDQTNALYQEYNIEPFGGEGFGEDPLAGTGSVNSPTGGGTGASEDWDYSPGFNYVQDDSGNYYFLATDDTYRDQYGNVYSSGSYEANQAGAGYGNYVDESGRQVMQGADGTYGFMNEDGNFTSYDLNSRNVFFDSQTGQQTAVYGDNFYNVSFDSGGQAYIMGEDGKTKWTYDSDNNLVATDEKGNKLLLNDNGDISAFDAQGDKLSTDQYGNVIDSSGNIVSSSTQFFQSGPSTITQRSLTGSSGLQTSSGGFFGTLSNGLGNTISGLTSGVGSMLSGTGYSTTGSGYSNLGSGYSSTGSGYSTLASGYSSTNSGLGSSGSSMSLPTGIGLPSGTVQGVLVTFLQWLLGVFGLLALISFLVSGIMYFQSVGNKEDAEKAKKHMQWSIIGVIVGLAGLIIISSITTLFQGGSFF